MEKGKNNYAFVKDPLLEGRKKKKKKLPFSGLLRHFPGKSRQKRLHTCSFKIEINQTNFKMRKGLKPFPRNIIGSELVECMKGKK